MKVVGRIERGCNSFLEGEGEESGFNKEDVHLQDFDMKYSIVGQVQRHLISNSKEGEEHAIALLRDYKEHNPGLHDADLVGSIHEGDMLLRQAIRYKSLSLVQYLCLEFAPNYHDIHYKNFDGSTSFHMAVVLGLEPIALFLHSLNVIDVRRTGPLPQDILPIKAFFKKTDKLLMALIRDPAVNFCAQEFTYSFAVIDCLILRNEETQSAMLERVGPQLNWRVMDPDAKTINKYPFIFAVLGRVRPWKYVLMILNHPSVDLKTLSETHLHNFIWNLCLNYHDPNIFFNVFCRLSQDQRWQARLAWVDCTKAHYLPGSNRYSNLDESQRKADDIIREGPICTLINHIESQLGREHLVFGLFLLFQDGYVEGKLPQKWQRFFNIMLQLPIDLQMVMCCRLEGRWKDYYTDVEVEGSVRKHLEWYGMYG
jgi:hypothetical protein